MVGDCGISSYLRGKSWKGFGIEYFKLRYAGGVLYKTRQLAQEEIKRCQDSVTFKKCRFTINEVRESK